MNEGSPWMTRREVADYLRVSVDTVDRRLVEWSEGGPVPGKLRFKRLDWRDRNMAGPVRICADDVYTLLPLPEEAGV